MNKYQLDTFDISFNNQTVLCITHSPCSGADSHKNHPFQLLNNSHKEYFWLNLLVQSIH